ncbi:helicase-like protein (plasmid) [Leptolyngbya boryana NIES-2135]|jgi:superfamily II DNA or RNA helicase|uniref:Helicase-like protein n=2 Tax=Leptolyngbya group TaxID=3081713 RepID=A0A1Z4JT15_LEPBY|nr:MULTISPECIES: SNF2-related protein [Leptolyngbya]BAS60021.1 RNA polymerase associated protein RapA [Leptolyngbya boryana IAM M-101]BAS66369.1 RNA polymerase associated protein RapA [Leptolyngbya boryana dg5]BAY59793.1 helicase-like protein [Leptolyngbya boryana NIES-2135]
MMPRSLQNHQWKISYSSDENNPVADFYIPALECAVKYDRKAGFFNSAILSKVARGLGAMLDNAGQMRLIMGCQFSPTDLQAIQKGYELRSALSDRLTQDLQPPNNFAQLKHFEILSWLIQNHYLDIRIAVPLKSDGIPENSSEQLDPNRLFHEKVGIITDSNGDRLAFSGSNNESIGGWYANVESFHVYLAWEGGRDLERVELERDRFEKLWNNQTANVRVFEVPEAVKRRLLQYVPKHKPTWSQEIEFDQREIAPEVPLEIQPTVPQLEDYQHEIEQFEKLATLHEHPGCLDFTLKTIPIQPWIHQIKILRRYAEEFPRNGLIADEVGLGKTIETGLILRYLILSKKAQRILVLAPTSVQPQWQDELREKFNLHFWSLAQGELRDPFKQSIPLAENPWNTQNLILASSHLVRRKERMQELLDSEPWDLVVLDEAHHARRKSPQNRKETPNRLLELMQKLKDRTKALLLLSATPMQIDPIEVFDLLNLLGLKGHWQYADNFCDYFKHIASEVDSHILNFWQQMSTDYFTQGGQPCPRLQQHLTKSDRLLAYKLEDIWQKGRIRITPNQTKEEAFITASRQFLTVNTPLKDLMFRHTRDTLRQYYKLGVLEKDVPVREVWDNAVVLESTREAELYRAVSDYVRHFYRLAQKENRKALGFLMTLYRKRLTSSFYAIERSLSRRLSDLQTGQQTSLTPDDLLELDEAEDAVIDGLKTFFEPVHPREIEYLQDLLQQFENTGEDTKCAQFLTQLRQELNTRDSAIVFTQYTDTMDYLREFLRSSFGNQLACYSGRGGELYRNNEWTIVPKEDIKKRFRKGEIKILLCTESASEGLNLQTCGVLINYDMPWNPMRVEQRIGRIDRIGQRYPTVRIHNFYYDGTVEAKVYRKLRDRIDAFSTVVGKLQPILAKVPTFIERALNSADPEEEDVLLSEFETVLESPPLRPEIDEMVEMDVQADLLIMRQPMASAPMSIDEIKTLLTTSKLLQSQGFKFEQVSQDVWKLSDLHQHHLITFNPAKYDEQPSLRLMLSGDPLLENILNQVLPSINK